MISHRRARSLVTLSAAGACLLLLGVACGGDTKRDETTSGGSAGVVNAAGGSVATASGGISASAGFAGASVSEGGSTEVGAGGASAGSANGGALAQGGAFVQGGADSAGGEGGSGEQPQGGAPGVTFECNGAPHHFASGVVDHEFGGGQSFGQDKFPDIVLGPPRGSGCCSGSTDVTSLGDGGWVVLEFANNVIVDGDGPDFLVFENAFVPANSGPESVYAELGRVSVSQDGQTWFDFPCASRSYPFTGCAGWHPVLANADTNPIDPTDASVAGGDPFDLAQLGLAWARYVSIQDVPEAEGGTGTFDLDAVSVVHSGCQ